jgi:internalin A
VVIAQSRVEEIFRQGILDTGLSEKEAEQETAFIMDYIAERSGLFIPRGESETGETLYAFTHLSFMEYFAAAHLRSEVEFWDKNGAEWQDLRERMQEPVWKEVFILFFELMENARQTEQYLARLVGGQPDIVAASDNFMPVLDRPNIEFGTWLGFYAWAMLAGVVMDTAIKMLPRVRQEYICLLWRFILSKNVQEEDLTIGGIRLVLEYLWSEKQGSLGEFQAQAAKMTVLYLEGRTINDLTPLSKLVHLNGLALLKTPVNDLTPLSNLVNLKRLDLFDVPVNDLTPLSRFIYLKRLYLSNALVNDLMPLSKLVHLKKLSLFEVSVNDLTPLSKLVQLEELDLVFTPVNDLTPLSKLVHLKNLNLSFTRLRKSDVEELRKKLPHTEIVFDED